MDKIINNAADLGADVIGEATGAVVGAVVGGVPGAAAGAVAGNVVGRVMKSIGEEIKARLLSKKEAERIETVLDKAKQKVENNLNAGKQIRTDGFFDEGIDQRSAAEEILEGTLVNAQKEYEEKKLPYMANLYANLAFDSEIGRAEANQLLKIASEITFRQLEILNVIGKFQLSANKVSDPRRKESYNSVSGVKNVSIASEIYDLYLRSLVFSQGAILDAAGINPSKLTLSGYGAFLFNLMELANMPVSADMRDIIGFMVGDSGKVIMRTENGNEEIVILGK